MLRSFKLKMALFAAAAAGVVFIAFALLFMAMIRRVGLERIDRQLYALAEAQLRRPPFGEHWERFDQSLAALYADGRQRRVLLRVFARSGEPVYASAGWPDALGSRELGVGPLSSEPGPPRGPPPGLYRPLRRGSPFAEPPGPRLALRPPRFLTAEIEGSPWRVAVLSSDALTLAAATDLAEFRAEMRRHWGTFAAAGPIALALLATGGWLLAGQALRPVRVLTRVAGGITAKGLDQRVAAPGADREFQALIDVINGMLDRLEASFQQAVRFSADAAHELKTPLTILQGQLEQALQRAPAGSAEQRTCADLLEEVQRLKGIVRKLLLLAQSDSGRLRLSLEPVRLNDELAALFEDLPLVAPGLALRTELAPDVQVQADPDLLRQVLQNVLSNAYKYNRDGGEIACSLAREGGRVVLRVSNTTDPSARLDRERLFDRFYRGDAARSRKVDGTGLGLSLAREIARAHGGDLVAEEAPDGWAAFRLDLPAKPA